MSAETGEVGSDKVPRLKMLGTTVLLGPLAAAQTTAGGLHYPPGHAGDRWQWLVLAVGPGRKLKDGTRLLPEIRPGDKVLFNPDRCGARHTFGDGRVIAEYEHLEMIWT